MRYVPKTLSQLFQFCQYSIKPIFGPFQFGGKPTSAFAAGQPTRNADKSRAASSGQIRGDVDPGVTAGIEVHIHHNAGYARSDQRLSWPLGKVPNVSRHDKTPWHAGAVRHWIAIQERG